MTTHSSTKQEDDLAEQEVDYTPTLVPSRGLTVVVREMSMLSHDGMGGYSILNRILDAGASVRLAEYNIRVEPDEPMRVASLAGPCMAMMLIRDAEDRKNKQGRYEE